MNSKLVSTPPIPSLRKSGRWPRLSRGWGDALRLPTAPPVAPRKPAAHSIRTNWPIAVILVAALVAAASLYSHFLSIAPLRWNSVSHDRNAHYLAGLRQAADVKNVDLPRLARDLDANGRVWPPLHSLLLTAVLLIGGADQRLAVLPSLAAWVAMIVFGFLLARRLAPRCRNLAGMTAAIFLFVSPAHRAYATDVMLESLGAMMTLAVLYAYVLLVRTGTRRTAIMFALSLTLLALTKYNYWLLAVIAMGAAELCRRPSVATRFFTANLSADNLRAWARVQRRRPLNYVLAGLVIVMAVVWFGGGWDFVVAGVRVKMTTNMTLATAAFAVLLVRLHGWWRAGGRRWTAERLGVPATALVHYHVIPMSIWLLLPQHLYWFIWYNSPANHGEAATQLGWQDTLRFYRGGFVSDYHVSPTVAALMAVLLPIACLACARRGAVRRGAAAVGLFLLLSAFLLFLHPNQKIRFLHTWLPVVWVAAGIAVAAVAEWFGRLRLAGRRLVAAVIVLSLGCLQRQGLAEPGHAAERGLHDLAGSWRVVTDSYLPELEQSDQVGVFSNMPVKFLAGWSYLERFGRADRLEIDLRRVGNYAPATRQGFERWVAETSCDTVVYIDVSPDSPYAEPAPGESNEVIGQMLPHQETFKLTRRIDLPDYRCTVAIWRRR